MKIGRKKIKTEELDKIWEIIKTEFDKIKHNSLGDATVVYNTIYDICTCNDHNLDELLYWKIGDFLYKLCREQREIIFNTRNIRDIYRRGEVIIKEDCEVELRDDSLDWIYKYVEEYKNFVKINEAISMLCAFLNDVLVSVGRGRKINEFGYLLWERCIIQQIGIIKRRDLGDWLIKLGNINPGSPLILPCLDSMKRIIPDPKDVSLYYRVNYEKKALECLSDKYREMVCFIDDDGYIDFKSLDLQTKNKLEIIRSANIPEYNDGREFMHEEMVNNNTVLKYVEYCRELIDKEKSTRCARFLPESYPLFDSCLDHVLIVEKSLFFQNFLEFSEDKFCAKNIFKELSFISQKGTKLMKDIFTKKHITKYIKEFNNSNPNDMSYKDLVDSIAKLYSFTVSIIKDVFIDDENIHSTFIKIFKNSLNQIANLPEKMAKYSHWMIEENKRMKEFVSLIKLIENKQIFIEEYLKYLSKRLLSQKKYFGEKEMAISLKDVCPNELTRKAMRMFQDIEHSFVLNSSFSRSQLRSAKTREKLDMERCRSGVGLIGGSVAYADWIYVTVLTLCAWPREDVSDVSLKLPPMLAEQKLLFERNYKQSYPRRKLTWAWEMGTAEIEIRTDKTYNIQVNNFQFIFLEQFNRTNKVLIKENKQRVISNESIEEITIRSLLSANLIIQKENFVFFNNNFKFPKTDISIDDMDSSIPDHIISNLKADIIIVYQCKISSILKNKKSSTPEELKICLKNSINEKLEVDKYKEAIVGLLEKGIIEEEGDKYFYVP
ncbi:Cullin-2 [Astathelohania contejeani]|uniref:Cullin-2 n=1 Tax=Astathelohania contejeani TaxID=164912 RepID=A0ABQ7I0F5_9MICR|nr:Cullin-2 [Thelohania contejeani]